ncbi:MAG: hypothetical protein AAGF12_26860 [Myxococcota bacterium]
MKWLTRFFGPAVPPHPVLLRVRDDAGPVDQVDLALTWRPSGRTHHSQQRTAMGLCIIPWLSDEACLEVAVQVGEATRNLTLDRDRRDCERVFELQV